MLQASPGLNIHHRFAPTREVVEAVLENRVEMGIVTLKPDGGPKVVDTLWLISRAEWPMSARAERAMRHLRESLQRRLKAD